MLDTERGNIAVGGQKVGDENVAGQDADVVIRDKGPDGEFGTVGDGTSAEKSHDEEGRVPGVEPVLEPSAAPELSTLSFGTRKESVESQTQEVVTQSTKESLGVEQT